MPDNGPSTTPSTAPFGDQLVELARAAGRAATAAPPAAIRRRGRHRLIRQYAIVVVSTVAVVAAGAVAIHASGPRTPEPAATVATTRYPTPGPTSRPPSPSLSPSVSGPVGPAVPRQCAAPDLVVSLVGGGAGSTHRSAVLLFTNTSGRTCRLRGYPGVAALNSAGIQVMQARRTLHGYLGGSVAAAPDPLTLKPGSQASAVVEGSAAMPDGRSCTGFAGLLVTIPDDTVSVSLPWSTDACTALEVHPVVAGATGNGP